MPSPQFIISDIFPCAAFKYRNRKKNPVICVGGASHQASMTSDEREAAHQQPTNIPAPDHLSLVTLAVCHW